MEFSCHMGNATVYPSSIYWLFSVGSNFLLERRIICRPIFEQMNTHVVKYFTECILSETQKAKKIDMLNKQIQLNNSADTINKRLTPVIRV